MPLNKESNCRASPLYEPSYGASECLIVRMFLSTKNNWKAFLQYALLNVFVNYEVTKWLRDTLRTSSKFVDLLAFSPKWTLKCFVRSPRCLKDFSHWSQRKGFSPVWILKWRTRTTDWLNDLEQWGHLWGFSPVWTLMWTRSWLDPVNDLRHCEQW